MGIRYIGNTPTLVGSILNEGNTPALFASVEMLQQGQGRVQRIIVNIKQESWNNSNAEFISIPW